ERIALTYKRPFSGHYFAVLVENGGSLTSRSLWDETLPITPASTGSIERHYITGPQRQPLLMLSHGFVMHDYRVTIAAAENLSSLKADTTRFQWNHILITMAILAILLAIQTLILRNSFERLKRVQQDMHRWEAGELDQLDEDVPGEVHPLVAEFNHLLAVIKRRLDRSRNALGNLAHALKAPLTLMQQMLESGQMDQSSSAREMQQQLDVLHHRIDTELARARLAGKAYGQKLNIRQTVGELIDILNKLYRDRGLAIVTSIPQGLTFSADKQDMQELFGNLMDNACKHAKTRVRLHLENTPGLVFSIEDDGPGSPQHMLDALAGRGVRVDEIREGHGLGLAIVKDIVDSYDGSLQFSQSEELGGFKASVQLPPKE
ncbi:MAG: sensor histidine kinase, partial [Mariprofundaceae bacterium]